MCPSMSIKSSVLLFSSLLFMSSIVRAEESKYYLQLNAGAALAQTYTEGYQSCSIFNGCYEQTYNQHFKPGYVASVAVGYKLAERFRVEMEGSFQSNEFDKWTYSTKYNGNNYNSSGTLDGERERTAFLLNGYYDFKNNSRFTPFITAGLGGYHLALSLNNQNFENELDFAWQAGAGINYALDDKISFDLKYRYFGGADAKLQRENYFLPNYIQPYDVGDHQIMAGIRIGF